MCNHREREGKMMDGLFALVQQSQVVTEVKVCFIMLCIRHFPATIGS